MIQFEICFICYLAFESGMAYSQLTVRFFFVFCFSEMWRTNEWMTYVTQNQNILSWFVMKVTDADKLSNIQSIPSLNDSYCWTVNNTEAHINANSVTKFTVITLISLSIILSNLMFIVTINSQIYSKFSNQQVSTYFTYLMNNV